MRTLELYKDGKKINEQPENENGRTTIRIENLDSNTTYEKGAYKLAWSKNGEVSDLVDVPSFKTKAKPTTTTTTTVAPTTTTTTTAKPTTTTTTTVAPTTTTTTAIAVTGVTLDKSTLSLVVGATGKLVATIAPSNASYKAVSYKSSDEEVATVDNTGKVTAVKPGSADITVTTKDGSKTAKCALTVTAKQIPVTGVTLDKSTLSLEVGATATLNATIAPSNASYKAVSFTSSDDAIATVDDDGLVTAVKAGTADITVESLMDGSKTAVCTLTVTEPEPEPEPEVPEEPEE